MDRQIKSLIKQELSDFDLAVGLRKLKDKDLETFGTALKSLSNNDTKYIAIKIGWLVLHASDDEFDSWPNEKQGQYMDYKKIKDGNAHIH